MKLLLSALLLVGSVVAHFIAVKYGVYDTQLEAGIVWFDNVLHLIVGSAFGIIWLWFFPRFFPGARALTTSLTLVLFVFIIAVCWELFEFAFYLIFKSGALGLKVYSPTIQEAFFDSLSNVLGAALLLIGRAIGRQGLQE